jgi:molybdopterin converting factor small subunit
MAVVWIPPLLQSLTGGADKVTVSGKTLRQVLNRLDTLYPGIKDALLEEDRILPGIAVVVDGEASHLGLIEPVGEESEIHFIPAISGG